MSSDQLWKKVLTCSFSQSGPDKPLIGSPPIVFIYSQLKRQAWGKMA